MRERTSMKYSFISYGSSNITPGATADYDLFTRDGRVAVTKGEPLSPSIAGLLRSHSLFRLCADLSVQTDVYRNSKLFESKDYLAAELAVEESLHSLERHEGLDLRALQRHDPYTFRHSRSESGKPCCTPSSGRNPEYCSRRCFSRRAPE